VIRSRLARVPVALRCLLLVAALQAAAWAIVTPPFQGPDEAAHFGYAQYLAETGDPPSSVGGIMSDSTEAGTALVWLGLRPLIGIPQARPAWSEADQGGWKELEERLPATAQVDGSGPNAVAKNPPLYYFYAAIPYKLLSGASLFDRLFAMRAFNALLYLGTVTLMWLIAAELFARTWVRTLATAAVALQPMLAFMGGGAINPDTLMVTIWTAFILFAVRMITRGPSLGMVVGLFGAGAAALCTHGRGIAIVPALLVVLVLGLARGWPGLRAAATRVGAGGALFIALVGLYRIAFVASGGGALYGGEINVPTQSFRIGQLLTTTWQFYFPRLGFMEPRLGVEYGYRQVLIESFFGSFASLEATLPVGVLDLLQVGAFIGVLAFALALWERRAGFRRHWPLVVALGATGLSLFALLHAASYRAILGTPNDPLIVGRYFLPLVALFGLAIAFTVQTLPERAGRWVATGLVCFGALLSLTSIGVTAMRFYV